MELKLFILTSKYLVEQAEVAKFATQHQQWLNGFYASGRIHASGKLNPLTGGFIMARAGSLEEIQKWINQDPFVLNKISKYEIVELNPSPEPRRSPEFSAYLARSIDTTKEV